MNFSLASPLLRTSLQRLTAARPVAVRRPMSSLIPTNVLTTWYNTFGRSTALYASWLMALIVVGEYATGKITDGLWTANNYGKTFETVDWSKFDEFEDEEEEDDDDDDDE